MKPTNEIRALLKHAGIRTSAARDESVLAEALRAGRLARDNRLARREPSVWRTIMRSRTTKFATAAVIVAAIIISLSQFNQPVVKAVEFSEFAQAVQKVPWMHATATGFELPVGQSDEHWVGFASRIQATKRANGRVIFMSEKDRRQFEYDPNNNTITISLLEAFPIDITSATMMPTTAREMWEQEGGQITVKVGRYKGRKVQVQEITPPNAEQDKLSRLSGALTLYVDSDSKLLYCSEVKAIDSVGNVVAAGADAYDYPQSGPQSIYDLGVPRDAHVLDRTPSVDFSTVWEVYKRSRAEAADKYVAVIAHQQNASSGLGGEVDVDYKSGRNERHERYYLSPRGEAIPELQVLNQEPPGSSLEPLLAWARSRYDDQATSMAVHLSDGRYYVKVNRSPEGGWDKPDGARMSGSNDNLLSPALEQAWPMIPSTSHVIEDEYAAKNGLICVENLVQGRVMPIGVGLPGRFLYYLDPAKDYLCRRQVMEWRPDADWQEDKSWLKNVDPKKVGRGSMIVQEITEAFQAPNGHWYPRIIVCKQTDGGEDYRTAPLKIYDIETIYLDVSPMFPEGIFDPNRLPGR